MKKIIDITVVIFLLIIFTPSIVFAHPGRTDSSGGHTCRTNCPYWGLNYGQYHYHNAPAPAPKPVPVPTQTPDPTPFPKQEIQLTPIITYEYEYESQKIPFKTSKVEDNNLEKGETYIKQSGIPGSKKITYKVTYENFVEKSRTKDSEEVVIPPTNEIIAVGTKEPNINTTQPEVGEVAGASDQEKEEASTLGLIIGGAVLLGSALGVFKLGKWVIRKAKKE